MKRKELQIPKNAAAAASVPVGKAKTSPAKKAADTKKKFQKRRKQYQHMMALIRLVIRIVNAAGRGTLYRK